MATLSGRKEHRYSFQENGVVWKKKLQFCMGGAVEVVYILSALCVCVCDSNCLLCKKRDLFQLSTREEAITERSSC